MSSSETSQAGTPQSRLRIVVGDDHPLVQAALETVLAATVPGSEVVPCYSLDEVLDAIAACPSAVDLVLLDLIMPGMNGILGLLQILKRFPMVPVAIISSLHSPAIVSQAIQSGASGFIPKSLSMPEMAVAVQRILAGEIWSPSSSGEESPNLPSREVSRRIATLSGQQLRVLTCVVQGKLNKQIAHELNVSEQTVKLYVSAVLRKLGVKTRTQAAVLVQGLIKTSPGDGSPAGS